MINKVTVCGCIMLESVPPVVKYISSNLEFVSYHSLQRFEAGLDFWFILVKVNLL